MSVRGQAVWKWRKFGMWFSIELAGDSGLPGRSPGKSVPPWAVTDMYLSRSSGVPSTEVRTNQHISGGAHSGESNTQQPLSHSRLSQSQSSEPRIAEGRRGAEGGWTRPLVNITRERGGS